MISIFNDVIGPVMRGPSSSHCAASLRIGRLARNLCGGELTEVCVEFDRGGALPTTHESQGSDMGLFGGLLGWDADDERLPDSPRAIREAGIDVTINIIDVADPHPNTYRLKIKNQGESHTLRAVSTGGGMIEVIDIDGFPIARTGLPMSGDYFETLIRVDATAEQIVNRLTEVQGVDEIIVHQAESGDGQLVEIKAQQFVSEELIESFFPGDEIGYVAQLAPVLPVMSRKEMSVPFNSCAEMLRYDADRNSPLWKLAIEYEAARGSLRDDEVIERMTKIVQITRHSIEKGIEGTRYDDRLLGHQSGMFQSRMEAGALLPGGVLNRIILYVTALMEVKSSMGVIVAAPTAGACAALPAACVAVGDEMGLPEEAIVRAMLAAGLVGAFIATKTSFAAEVGGCQAECGSAACMAAAAITNLAGGNTTQALDAASMALQGSLGLVCAPIANRVEAPCLGNNINAATNALVSTNMVLADYDAVVPLDEVIGAADQIGQSIARELRCTALGGLSITSTSKRLEQQLADKKKC